MAEKPLHQKIYLMARSLNKGALLLSQNVFEGQKDGDYIAPTVLCDTFCIELLLKTLQLIKFDDVFTKNDLAKKGIKLNEHKYSKVYSKIDEDIKTRIVDSYNEINSKSINKEDFKNILIQLGDNNFVEWRYIFESDTTQHLDYQLQKQVLDALGKTIEKILQKSKC